MFDPRESLSVTQDGDLLFAKARQYGVETVWERHEAQQPQCGFCDMDFPAASASWGRAGWIHSARDPRPVSAAPMPTLSWPATCAV